MREAERAGTCRRGEENTWGRSWHLAGGNEDGGARLFSVAFSDRTKWTQVRGSIWTRGNSFLLRGWSNTGTGFLESLRGCYPCILTAWVDIVQGSRGVRFHDARRFLVSKFILWTWTWHFLLRATFCKWGLAQRWWRSCDNSLGSRSVLSWRDALRTMSKHLARAGISRSCWSQVFIIFKGQALLPWRKKRARLYLKQNLFKSQCEIGVAQKVSYAWIELLF